MTRQLLLPLLLCTLVIPTAPNDVAAQEEQIFVDTFGEVVYLEQVVTIEPEEPPEDIMAWVEMPKSVLEGESFVLRITIENGLAKEYYRISSVDIDTDFLHGFKIISIVPEPRHRDDDGGYLEIEFPVDLQPREDWEVEITLQAEKPGVYVGDVDIWAGDDYVTRIAQARVH